MRSRAELLRWHAGLGGRFYLTGYCDPIQESGLKRRYMAIPASNHCSVHRKGSMSSDQQSQSQQEQHLRIENVPVVFPMGAIDVIHGRALVGG